MLPWFCLSDRNLCAGRGNCKRVFTSGFFDQQQKSWKIREVLVLAGRLLRSSRQCSIALLFRLQMIPSEDRSMPCGVRTGSGTLPA